MKIEIEIGNLRDAGHIASAIKTLNRYQSNITRSKKSKRDLLQSFVDDSEKGYEFLNAVYSISRMMEDLPKTPLP